LKVVQGERRRHREHRRQLLLAVTEPLLVAVSDREATDRPVAVGEGDDEPALPVVPLCQRAITCERVAVADSHLTRCPGSHSLPAVGGIPGLHEIT